MDINQLVNVTVTSLSSKHEEPVADAGGNVTVYSSNDMDQLSYYTIGELADITPGYSTHTRFGEQVLETRGQIAASFNNDYHRLLVDGIPVHHARNYKVPIENEMPLYFANKIEFLRGPASTLYGASAFSGVINVSPQEFRGKGLKIKSRLSMGSEQSGKQLLLNAFYNSSLGESNMSLGLFKKEDSEKFVGNSQDPNWLLYDRQNSKFAYFRHRFVNGLAKGLSVGVIYNHKKGGLGESWAPGMSHPSNSLTWESIIPYAKYEVDILDTLKFSGYIKYNRSRESGSIVEDLDGPIFGQTYESKTENYETQGELTYAMTEKTNLIIGANYDTRREFGFPHSKLFNLTLSGEERDTHFIPNTTDWFQLSSVYAQVQHHFDFLAGTTLSAGTRMTYAKMEGKDYKNFSPRIALVQKLRSDLNFKLMYNEAFRTPGIKEIGFNIEKNITPLPVLKPEIFTTKEVSLVYHRTHWLIELTAFHNTIKDMISSISGFRNLAGKTKLIGGEVTLNYEFNHLFNVNFNYSYAKPTKPDGSNFNDIPSQKANLILRYTDRIWDRSFNAALINRWVKDFRVSNSTLDRPKGFYTLDINIGYQVLKNIKLGLQIRNLLNTDYKIPKDGAQEIPVFDRSFWGHLIINY